MTKYFCSLLFIFLAQTSMACLDYSTDIKICPGDLVYKGSTYSDGATVVSLDAVKKTAYLRSNLTGNYLTEKIYSLFITRGCLGVICVNSFVYKGSSFIVGATVLGINPNNGTVTLSSNYGRGLSVDFSDSLDLAEGCVEGVCVNDVIYKGRSYDIGAMVVAVNYQNRNVTVRSNYSGGLSVENPKTLEVTNKSFRISDAERANSFQRK